jgi:hypothetical protein
LNTTAHSLYRQEVGLDHKGNNQPHHRSANQLAKNYPTGRSSIPGRTLGHADLWITEYTIPYQDRPTFTDSIMQFHNGKVVHKAQHFADPVDPHPGEPNGSG